MKSRQITVQNQRIERISSSTLVARIDIAKEKHVAQATTFREVTLAKRAIEFSVFLSGFEQLYHIILMMQQTHGMNDVIAGMESTSHYWFSIANWLNRKGIEVVRVNFSTTKRNKERSSSPSAETRCYASTCFFRCSTWLHKTPTLRSYNNDVRL
ncbi:IS110 family transposase [Alicyclobacillus tolerans]|uniref:IS110 family transposase n=1 Tax=Alicyclobacillus tolerans TaxID=90970 RepID=UPI003B78B07B